MSLGSPGMLTRKLQDLYFGACKGENDTVRELTCSPDHLM